MNEIVQHYVTLNRTYLNHLDQIQQLNHSVQDAWSIAICEPIPPMELLRRVYWTDVMVDAIFWYPNAVNQMWGRVSVVGSPVNAWLYQLSDGSNIFDLRDTYIERGDASC